MRTYKIHLPDSSWTLDLRENGILQGTARDFHTSEFMDFIGKDWVAGGKAAVDAKWPKFVVWVVYCPDCQEPMIDVIKHLCPHKTLREEDHGSNE